MTEMSEERKHWFHYLFTTAMEGGIEYWSVTSEYRWSKAGTDFDGSGGIDDTNGFYAILESSEDDWGVADAYIAECDETLDITETQALRVDIKVMVRGWDLFVHKVMEATKSEDPQADFSNLYFKQAIVQYLTNMEDGDSDADVADLVVQLGLFGEIVYS